MLPIYCMYDSAIDRTEERAILDGLSEFLNIFPNRKIINFGSRKFADEEYGSADWYIKHAKKFVHYGRIQLDAESVIDMMMHEPWQNEPHIDLFFVSNDLTIRNEKKILDFCYGLTCANVSVQSVYRYRKLPTNDRYLAVKLAVLHELGHILGMCSDSNRAHTENCQGTHCTIVGCAMRQGITTLDWVLHAREVDKKHFVYCPNCLAEARKHLV